MKKQINLSLFKTLFVVFFALVVVFSVSAESSSYKETTPEDFLAAVKAGNVANGDKFVMTGLIFKAISHGDKTDFEIQKAGTKNVFVLGEKKKFTTGQKVRVYFKVLTVNSTLVSYCKAQVDKLEEL
jgi:hypothetical protein